MEMVTIACMMTVPNLFINDSSKAVQEYIRKFAVEEGDLLTLLNMYYAANEQDAKWCQKHNINYDSFCKAQHLKKLILKYMQRLRLPVKSSKNVEAIQKSIQSAMFMNAAVSRPDGTFKDIRTGIILSMHPSSVLFRRVPSCVVYFDVIQSSKAFMRQVTVVESDRLIDTNYFEYQRK